jgi:CheY-like chemotaxis protein/EAL domain-containing protein (putative c-di-GMP-specific phosphodiesterase class I)
MELDQSAPEGPEALRLVLLDPDAATRGLLRTLLETTGISVKATGDSVDALDALASGDFDLLLATLPADEGRELAAAMRGHGPARELPLVFLAPPAQGAARYRAIAAGADEVLVKPVDPLVLVQAIRARVARARLLRAPAVAGPEPALRGGQLRRGEFLAQLGTALRDGARRWRVLMALRLDQNQTLSDQLGQAASFELEQALAVRFAEALRADDSYTLWMEFGFGLLAERESREEVEALARDLCQRVAETPFILRGQSHALTLSIGVALPPAGGDEGDPDRWFASAYAAQAIAHRLGGNRHDGVLSFEYGDMPPERVLIIREWAKEARNGGNVLIEFQPMLPLRPGMPGMYALGAKLRDYRAPLAGVVRREYLRLAREAGSLAMIDRMGLFEAFEAIEQERAIGHDTRVLVPVDLASADEAQLTWLDAELRRRHAFSDRLVIEFEAGLALADANFPRTIARLRSHGVMVALSDASTSAERVRDLCALPADWLRLPAAAIAEQEPEEIRQIVQPWLDRRRALIVGEVEDTTIVASLAQMNVGYIQGDALAAGGPRLDYSFAIRGA